MAQKRNYTTKKRGKTECDPLWEMADIKNIVEWFEKNNEWDGYLITLIELLLGRRISDTIFLKWSDFYFQNGKRKNEMNTVIEQKTGKTTPLAISSMVFEAIENYTNHKKIHPIDHLDEYIFEYEPKTKWINRGKDATIKNKIVTVDDWCILLGKDLSDKRKKNIVESFKKQKEYDVLYDYLYNVVEKKDVNKWETDDYRKKLKRAVKECNITYDVSTHSLRKSFAYWIYTMHPFDPNCPYSLQKMFNHSTILQTFDYMCVTKMRNKKYLEDHGDFIRNVLAGKGDEIVKNMPVISLKSDDFGDIILRTIKSIQSGKDATETYQAAINMGNEMRVV